MTEAEIQYRLWRWREPQGHRYITPNTHAFRYDIDLLSVTRAGMSYDHEIKVSRQDLKTELGAASLAIPVPRNGGWSAKRRKHFDLQNGRATNYYNLVFPVELYDESLPFPDYAGIILYFPALSRYINCFEQVKKPTRLHDRVVTKHQYEHLTTSIYWRYWTKLQTEKLDNDDNETDSEHQTNL